MISFSEADIRDAVSRSAFAKARDYWRQGRVESVTVSPDGAEIRSEVRGLAPIARRRAPAAE